MIDLVKSEWEVVKWLAVAVTFRHDSQDKEAVRR